MSDLDRAVGGIPRRCCECAQTFAGEYWQDYCAKCHAENEKNSPLRKRWACLTCNSTFEAGSIRSDLTGFQCPNCRSGEIGPAEGVRELSEYYGEIPWQKQ